MQAAPRLLGQCTLRVRGASEGVQSRRQTAEDWVTTMERKRGREGGREGDGSGAASEGECLSLIHISEPTRPRLI
eukprot:904211-Rhodomonas_salina.1